MTGNWINVTGLMFDIAGAALLGRAIVFNGKERIAQQTALYFNFNKFLLAALVEQRLEGAVGLSLLVFGFGLQALSDFTPGEAWAFYVGTGCLALLLIAFFCLRGRIAEKQTEKLIAYIQQQQKVGQ